MSENGGGRPDRGPERRRLRKRLVLAGGIALVVLLLALAFRPTALIVETGTVTRGPLEITVDADGVTRLRDRYQLAAPTSGRLQRISAREGDMVAAGTVLARITPVPLDPQGISQARAAVASAEARLEEANQRLVQARSTMELSQRTAERVRAVVAEGGLSVDARERAELEASNAEREYAAAQARVRGASSEVASARAALLDVDPAGSEGSAAVSVVAPAGGRVLRIHERSERVVPAGTPLLDIGDAAGLEVVVDVLSTDAVRIHPGAPVRVEEWGGEGVLMGSVRQVEPAAFTRISTLGVEEQRVNVIADLLEAPTALGDGYRVEAKIVVWSNPDVLKVPSSALFREGAGWAVFAVDSGRARLRMVEVGQRSASEAEVHSGLESGEEVVLFPSDALSDGSRVRPEG